MSHAGKADKLLIKPAAGARPAPPCHPDRSFPRHTKRPVTRRVTSSTETPGWRRPQTDRPAESHSPLNVASGSGLGTLAEPIHMLALDDERGQSIRGFRLVLFAFSPKDRFAGSDGLTDTIGPAHFS